MLIGGLVIFALASDAIPAVNFSTAEGRFERHLTVTGPVDLDLRTGSGGIDVRTGDATTVHVFARIKARGSEAAEKVKRIEANPPIDQQGNVIRIGRLMDRELQNNVSIQYEVTVPRETRLAAHTGSGNQSIDGVRGPVEAQSGSGNLVVANTGAGLSVRAGSGDIRANAVGSPFTGHTGSGNIRAALTGAGDVEARTGSGNVDLHGVHGRLAARAGSGNLTAEGEATGSWDLTAGSGDVTLRLPPQASFDVLLRAGSGRITTDRALTMQGSVNRHRVEGRVGSGGPLLSVTTGSGNIRVQ
jgi:DUF4097 and DUF4098 domain-containing protein YvlB